MGYLEHRGGYVVVAAGPNVARVGGPQAYV